MYRTVIVAIGVASFLWLSVSAHAATNPADACKDTKAKAAGKKAADLMKAFGKNCKRSDPTRLNFSISKAQSKFTKQFTKAEAKGGCVTNGDAAAIEAKVDALVNDIVGGLSGAPTTTTTTTSSTTTTTIAPACDCCAVADQVSFTAATPSGNCGVLRSFRCSNDAHKACVSDADCDELCGALVSGFCGDLSPLIVCTSDADCQGTCGEAVALGLPLDLACGLLSEGGGGAPFPPVPISDTMTLVADVTGCNSGTGALTLGPTTSVETGSALTCTSSGCLFGAPLPFVSPSAPPFSMCGVPALAQDASGTGDCDGEMSLDLSMDIGLYLTGDLLQATTPPDVPGIQPCPLCVRQCGGGTNDRFPCADDTDCTGGGTCGVATECLGGDNDTDPCTPGTTSLGDAFPTSQDCQPEASVLVFTAPLDVTLSTADLTINAKDLGSGTGAPRTFCGFCRDNFGSGSLCFEGDPDLGCAPGGASTFVACQSDADCDDGDEYESCSQRTSGAFAKGTATRLTLMGSSADQCLADGLPRATTVAGSVCFPPSFDSFVDAVYDWPGPGALTIQGDVTLLP